MSVDDRPADRQPHARSTGLRSVKGFKDLVETLRINARAGIAHGHDEACLILLCADQQLSRPLLHRIHCFSGIQNQIQQDLLQLNAISQNRKYSLSKPGLDRNAMPEGHASSQCDYFVDSHVKIETLFPRRLLLDLLSDAIDDFSSPIGISDETGK